MRQQAEGIYLWDNLAKRVKKERRTRKMCECCNKRVAVYYQKGHKKRRSRSRVRTGKHHTLCIQCYSRELDSMRAERLKEKENAVEREEAYRKKERKLKLTEEERAEKKRRKRRARKRRAKKRRMARRRAQEEKRAG